MMEIRGLSSSKAWDYENGFYWFSPYSRISKQIAHWEIYKKILNVPGEILELGVLKGASLIRWATFREITENGFSRKIIGFDAFGEFPVHQEAGAKDLEFIKDHEEYAGNGIEVDELYKVLENKGLKNIELNKGDVFNTIPKYLDSNTQLRIAMLHLDMDTYHPTLFALENFWDRISTGGIVIIDDYNSIAGATDAVDLFISRNKLDVKVEKNPYYSVPSFIIKE